jgi:hypothetical protein
MTTRDPKVNEQRNIPAIELDAPDSNRDPITGTPGAHPVGTGIGAAGAGAAGAAIGGAVGGPVGAIAGAVVGGVAGGLGGKAAAEAVNPTAEDAYWRAEHANRPYFDRTMTYEDYRPAYSYGWESFTRYRPSGRRYEDVETDLERSWDQVKGRSRLTWHKAKDATQDAWNRLERALPGDADRDGL